MIARILSCHDRCAQLEATLGELARSDWGAEPVVHLSGDDVGTRLDRINANWQAALRGTMNSSVPSLILEDDVRLNRHLRHNLERWRPSGKLPFFGSLYNGAKPTQLDVGPSFFVADPHGMWGSQGLVIAPAMAAHLLEHWEDESGFADTRMPRLAARRGPVYHHVPSLVQHVGTTSTWGGPFHQAVDFDADWRAPG